ncbi:HAD family hydrolase [Anaerovibrio sp.]|uniref:HAD family hydrolase n=1 Tax=Anaerovibrio sp. TaxID=1872532 RepID=UPI003F160C20
MLKGAIFDMDGLLLDTERLYCQGWIEAAKAFRQPILAEFPRAVCGSGGKKMLDIVHEHYPEVDAAAFRDYCLHWVEDRLQREIPEKPGTREILCFFHEHDVKLAVASSTRLDAIKDSLGRLGVLPLFDAVVSGQQVEHGKPAPDIFLLAAEKIGCAPDECYVFEDSANGIRAGVAAGCRTIMIPDLIEPDAELRSLADDIYGSLSEVMEAVLEGKI